VIAVSAVGISFVLGAVIGGFCGYRGGRLDRWVGRFVDVLMAFPLFVLAMAMVAALGNRVENIVIATAIINLPFYIRFARAEVNVRRNSAGSRPRAPAATAICRSCCASCCPTCCRRWRCRSRSISAGPSSMPPGLSFIGLGVSAPTPEWGIMVAEGARFITTGKWWLVAISRASR
jgi:peptide/nickel transport system permease protein